MHVILAGAGIGGLIAALALAERSIAVTLIERSPAFGEVGAGVQLSPNATRLLVGLGLEGGLRAIAFAPQAAEVRDHASGALLLRTEFGAAAERRWGGPYLQVHRADLHALLAEAVVGRPGVNLRLGSALASIRQDGAAVEAELSDGSREVGDALIGCDGIHSTVRAALWGARPARFTGQTAWRGLVDTRRLTEAAAPLAMVWTGPGKHFVHYPLRGGRLVNFVGVVAGRGRGAESWTEPGDPSALRADFRDWPDPVVALTQAAEETWRYAIHDRPALPRWARGRISLLGDAAHPAPPFLAQGAAMAVEDAEALARRLSTTASVESALLAYETERRDRTARVQAWSRRNARLFHLPGLISRPLVTAANLIGRVAAGDMSSQLDWLYGYSPPT